MAPAKVERIETAGILMEIKDRGAALKELVAKANESGGEDKVTAVIIDFNIGYMLQDG